MDHVHTEGDQIGQQAGNGAVTMEHYFQIGIVFLDDSDLALDAGLDEGMEHDRGHERTGITGIIIAGEFNHIKVFAARLQGEAKESCNGIRHFIQKRLCKCRVTSHIHQEVHRTAQVAGRLERAV